MLFIKDIDVYYSSIQALYGISLEVNEGEIFALLGRNGAGKTTVLKSCVGLLPVQRGSIQFRDEKITNLEPRKICSRGISYVFQERSVFPELSVLEHLKLAISKGVRGKSLEEALTEAVSIFPDLEKRIKASADTLSGGEAQMLEISMALVREPKLLILDEPSQGLSFINIRRFIDRLRVLKDNMTVFLSEQNIEVALELSDKVAVIRDGMVIHQGTKHNMEKGDQVFKKLVLG
jgi:branched-chain amino acid transport system ATP-binding protein